MTKIEIIKEMLGDDISALVASELKDAFEHLQTQIDDFGNIVPVYSYEKKEEIRKVKKIMKAIKRTHSYFSCDIIEG